VSSLVDKTFGNHLHLVHRHSNLTHWIEKLQAASASARLLIAVAGIPGSGKTTLALSVAKGVNDLHHAKFHKQYPNSPSRSPSQPDIASVVPLDGYHLTRKQLSEMPNAEEAVFRRGAAFTFDGTKYLKLVEKLRKPLGPETSTIWAPSFDHAVKDPIERDIPIAPTTQVVIFEGLYTVLDREPWREAAALMDELWFIDVSMDLAVARLVKRHVASGISPDPEHARTRVVESDMRNGKEILEYRLPVQEIIKSVEDDSWKTTNVKKVEQEEELRPRTERLGSLAELAESGGGL
jgi:pantothenate kinase